MKHIWKYLLTVILSVGLSYLVLNDALADEGSKNRQQMSVYFVDAMSSTDLMRMRYLGEIERMREDMRVNRDLMVYLSLKFANFEDEILIGVFEPDTEIWCFVRGHTDGSNIVKLEDCFMQ